jgi:arylsulfatase A-like enzyme
MSRHGNRAFDAFRTPWEETLPGIMRAAGYRVAHVGKWHTGPFPAERWDFGRAYSGRHWTGEGPDRRHVTRRNQDDALEFLRETPADRPFFLTVAFFAPHAEDNHPEQYLPQPDSLAWYGDAPLAAPPNGDDAAFARLPPFLAHEENEGRVRWRKRFDSPEKYRRMMANYYRLVTEVDAACGAILAELDRQGRRDNTVVVFTTDNGYFHGEHGLADKWYPHEESIRVPLIVDDPRLPRARRGTTADAFVLNVDLAPTLLAAAGLAAPAGMQGADFAPLYLGAAAVPWRTEFFYEHATIRNTRFIPASEALVRKDLKYFYWPDFGHEQLFDLAQDPREDTDRFNDPAYAAPRKQMRARFAELKAAAR